MPTPKSPKPSPKSLYAGAPQFKDAQGRADLAAAQKRSQTPVKSNKVQAVLKTNQQRISPMGVQQRDQQIKKSQDALMAKRLNNGNYNSSGTN